MSRLPATNSAAPAGELEQLVARIAEAVALRTVRAALQDLPGSAPRFCTLRRAARTLGLGESTLRRKARAAGVRRQAGGRYVFAELEAAAAGRAITAAPPVADLATARARRVAEALIGRKPA